MKKLIKLFGSTVIRGAEEITFLILALLVLFLTASFVTLFRL